MRNLYSAADCRIPDLCVFPGTRQNAKLISIKNYLKLVIKDHFACFQALCKVYAHKYLSHEVMHRTIFWPKNMINTIFTLLQQTSNSNVTHIKICHENTMPEDRVFECFLLIALIKYLVMHFLCYKVSGIGIVICSHCFRNVDFISILVYRRNGSFLQVFYI